MSDSAANDPGKITISFKQDCSDPPLPVARAERPAATILHDEAIELLLARLEDEPLATLQVHVDNGLYRASFIGQTVDRGEACPVLTDALVSLVEALR